MGWSGYNNVWYNLPNIDSVITYYSINKCVYNIYPSGTGEIISGRVTDKQGNPVNEATVRATRRGGGEYIASTNANGIYALDKIPSSSTYIISVSKAGYAFVDQLASTGVSTDNSTTTGNKWGLNFTGGPPRYTLPDSGQTTCYNSSEKISCPNPGQRYYGQDANYKGVQPSYRNNGDGTVSDLVTGLMWNTDAGARLNWFDAVTYCQDMTLGEYTDWRLPSRKELLSLVVIGHGDTTISQEFTYAPISWSNVTQAGLPSAAWYVDFASGRSLSYYKTFGLPVRCVRGDPF